MKHFLLAFAWLAAVDTAYAQFSVPSTMFGMGEEVGEVQGSDLDEVSGLAASWRNEGILWTHNDGGGSAIIHALTVNGEYIGGYRLDGVDATDIEDIAVGPGPEEGKSYIYLGDIGNNFGGRRNTVQVYRVKEPPTPSGGTETLDGVDIIALTYPNGVDDIDAETLMVDPILGEIYVVEKDYSGSSTIYATSPSTTKTSGSFSMTLEDRGGVGGEFTAGDISRDGREILLKTYQQVFYLTRSGNNPVSDSILNGEGFTRLGYSPEDQGEAITFAFDLAGFYTLSEHDNANSVPLLYYPRKAQTPNPTEAPTPRPTRKPTRRPTRRPTKKPTRRPTQTPTAIPPGSPTPRPTANPTPKPTLPKLNSICNDEDCTSLLKQCQGDCDTDFDCEGDLICWQRFIIGDPVPGCVGEEAINNDSDFCIIDPLAIPAAFRLNETLSDGTANSTNMNETEASSTNLDETEAEELETSMMFVSLINELGRKPSN